MDADEVDWNQSLRDQWEFHIHRELIHHLSEVCLLRDLYLHTNLTTNLTTNGASR